MEIVNIEASAFMEMNDILFKIEKQLKGLNSSKSELNEWLDNQDVCILMNISDRKLLSLRQKGLIPFSRIDRKIYYKKEDILSYVRNNLKTYTNNGNGIRIVMRSRDLLKPWKVYPKCWMQIL